VLSAAAVVAIAALYWTALAWFHRWTTETDVTNLRVVHKAGFIKRRTFEMSLDKVESVDVNQSILGRIMNYGDVTVVVSAKAPRQSRTIASPLEFRNYNHRAIGSGGATHGHATNSPANMSGASTSTVEPCRSREVLKLSDEWWDPRGKMAPPDTRSIRCG